MLKALPKGIYDSGKGIFLFVSDLVTHPVRTGEQIWDVLTLLSKLACSEQWGALSEVIAPEVHQLVKEWDTLASDTRGELAGYAFGKHGSDIFIPGALAKAVSKGVKGAQELSTLYRGLQTAEKTLLLETVTGLESAKIAEVIQTSQRTITLGEELGLTPHQMGQLKQAGNLEGAVTNAFENLINRSENEAFRTVSSSERHAGFLKNNLGRTIEELQKGIKSFEKQIIFHEEKILNPSKHIKNWHELDPRQQKALINKKWPDDIQRLTEQRDILQSILKEKT